VENTLAVPRELSQLHLHQVRILLLRLLLLLLLLVLLLLLLLVLTVLEQAVLDTLAVNDDATYRVEPELEPESEPVPELGEGGYAADRECTLRERQIFELLAKCRR